LAHGAMKTVTSLGKEGGEKGRKRGDDYDRSSERPMDSSSAVYGGLLIMGTSTYAWEGQGGGNAHMRRHHQGPMWGGATHRLYGTKSLAEGMWCSKEEDGA